MDAKTAVKILTKTGDENFYQFSCLRHGTMHDICESIEKQEKHVEELKEILQDVLSDCYLSDGMRLEIERLTS